MRTNARLLWAVVALGALARGGAAQTPPATPPTGQAATAEHVTKAQTFLRDEAKGSLAFLHVGCTLKGVNTDTVTRAPDGTFTVSVRYAWSGLDNGNDHTDIHYAFNTSGRLTALRVGDTTATVFTPYSVADIGIQLLRDALLKDLQRQPPEDPLRRVIEPRIRTANAQTLHLLTLQLRQPR